MCVAGDFSLDKDPTNHQRRVTEAEGNGGEEGVSDKENGGADFKRGKENWKQNSVSTMNFSQMDRENWPCVC